ncbi:hypothetical protein CF15_04080 [Pyrodictium occultum]|uniref:GGDEF domain-containing protein n=1 Tax=Pyrodictium occultum TaxID=2309 RepID=A0A0V8RXA7_PYROC|nr:hypothetical protein [Pyrodictium occultum]KSW12700.1 hypothetical protein CF15_04080 [Pyrodictium occultum]
MRRRAESSGHIAVEGSIVMIDLDRFGEVVEERGWSEYQPNPATGLLTSLVESFLRKWHGVIVYGLDETRGTEEAVIEIPLVEPVELRRDLERIQRELNSIGVGVTIVAVKGYVLGKPARSRREAYTATPFRRYAASLLREAKRRGGNRLIIA